MKKHWNSFVLTIAISLIGFAGEPAHAEPLDLLLGQQSGTHTGELAGNETDSSGVQCAFERARAEAAAEAAGESPNGYSSSAAR
jgi:hypothetical protein